jgi:hypothetical protein
MNKDEEARAICQSLRDTNDFWANHPDGGYRIDARPDEEEDNS